MYYYIIGGHASVGMLANASGSITDTYSYDAYGELTDRSGTTDNSYLYSGEYRDETTGLYYLRAGYMDAETGRFITPDSY